MSYQHRNIGSLVQAKIAYQGATTEAASVNGAWIDRLALPSLPALSAVIMVPYSALLLPSGGTLVATVHVDDATSTDGTGSALYSALATGVTYETNSTTGQVTRTGVIELPVNLSAAKGPVRAVVNITASGTGTVSHSALVVFGGGSKLPA